MSEEDEFQAALNGEDELGAVIRAHIHIESLINEFLELNFTVPAKLEKLDLEFHQKVQLALACGLRPDTEAPLNALATLRNKFAHRLNTKIGSNEANALYSSFTGDDKQIIQGAFQRTNRQLDTKGPKSITKLKPKDQFILMAISLRAIMQIEINRVKNVKNA